MQFKLATILVAAAALPLMSCADDVDEDDDEDAAIEKDAAQTAEDASNSATDAATETDAADGEKGDPRDGSPDAENEDAQDAADADANADAEEMDAADADAETDAEDADAADGDAPSPELSGHVLYEKRAIEPDPDDRTYSWVPARGIIVELLDSETSKVLASRYTDAEGAYVLPIKAEDLDPEKTYYLRASAYYQNKLNTFKVIPVSRSNKTYAVASENWQLSQGSWPEGVTELKASATEGIAGAFNIMNVLYDWLALIARNTTDSIPGLTFRWTKSEEHDTYYSGDYIYLGGQPDDTDEFDDLIIAHEFGHHFIATMSHDDSRGGQHRDTPVEPSLAYGEGVAYFLACLVYKTPVVIDTFIDGARIADFEAITLSGSSSYSFDELTGTTDRTVEGYQHEELVGGIMWDLYDADSDEEPWDTVAIGERGSMEILLRSIGTDGPDPDLGANWTDMTDYVNAAVCLSPAAADLQSSVDAVAVNHILERVSYPWDAQDAMCRDKYHIPSPVAFTEDEGELKLSLKPGAAASDAGEVIVYRQGSKASDVCSHYPCRVASRLKSEDAVYIAVGYLNGERYSTSFVTEEARKRLIGHYRDTADGYREFRSAK